MPQKKIINWVQAADTFDDVERHQILIEAIIAILYDSCEENATDKAAYLLSIYEEKMRDTMSKLEKILMIES